MCGNESAEVVITYWPLLCRRRRTRVTLKYMIYAKKAHIHICADIPTHRIWLRFMAVQVELFAHTHIHRTHTHTIFVSRTRFAENRDRSIPFRSHTSIHPPACAHVSAQLAVATWTHTLHTTHRRRVCLCAHLVAVYRLTRGVSSASIQCTYPN